MAAAGRVRRRYPPSQRRRSEDEMLAMGGSGLLTLPEDAADYESDIRRPLTEPAHEVGKPFAAEWNIDAHAIARLHQHRLEVPADAVQHLELEAIRRHLMVAR